MTDADVPQLRDGGTGRLSVLSHEWVVSTSTPVLVEADGLEPLEVSVAEPVALAAMSCSLT